jgi:hypothetical protein
MATALLKEPRWHAAAQALVDGCIDLPNDDDRVALMAAVCEGLGTDLYPAFLRVLWVIGQHGDHAARAAVARTLVHALSTGRLPSGRRNAWGASSVVQSDEAYGRTRSLGPLEYLCAWAAQADAERALPAEQFDAAARAVMDLIDASREARRLYCEKMLADVDDPIGGALSRDTREAMRALATAWGQGASSLDASARFLGTLAAARRHTLSTLLPRAAFAVP